MRFPAPASRRLLLCLLLAILLFPTQPAEARPPASPWSTCLPLSYFVLNTSLQTPMRIGARLSQSQFAAVRRVAEDEQAKLRHLLEASQPIVNDPVLSLEQKRLYIQRISYNRQVNSILYATYHTLRANLAPDAYTRLVAWMETRWPLEVRLHGRLPTTIASLLALDLRFWVIPQSAPRTYEIFATRYNSKGRYTAAIPDQCVKLTNGGLSTCSDKGYVVGQRYEIFMSYKNGKKGVGVVVAEAGPWNIDDNFWATLADPTPRRMFADLPLGMPEAQAAFYNDYNGGLDQYGRKVTAPFAIDLAFEVADDLGLPPKTNDWINVSFLWTDGWGSGSASSGSSQAGSTSPAAISPVETAAFKPDGSQVHTVQAGQTLWAIAVAYGTTVESLRGLNGLAESSVILPGQELRVRPPGPISTADDVRVESEIRPSPTIRTADTQTAPSPGTPLARLLVPHPEPTGSTPIAGAFDPGGKESAESTSLVQRSTSLFPYTIAGLVLAGLALYALGRWLSKN